METVKNQDLIVTDKPSSPLASSKLPPDADDREYLEDRADPQDQELQGEEDEQKKINWLIELRALALMLLAVGAFHSLFAKPFYIPSGSMMPNLLVGDRLVVSKYPYGWSWVSASFHILPRSDWRIWPATPEYGDVVIPVPPDRNEDYIKRVVALPGDRIAIKDGQIILNGTPVPQEVEPPVRMPIDANNRCDFGFNPKTGAPYDYIVPLDNNQRVCAPPTYRETLPNGATYLIIDHREQSLDNYDEITVPEGHVFVLGDNRDHSADSRAESFERGLGGPIPLENIGGRAEFITFSMDGSSSWNPLSWWGAMRGERALTTLRPPLVEGAE